jgi:uncharacterized protein (DUF2345 family)
MSSNLLRQYIDILQEAVENVSIEEIAAGLEFLPTTKKPRQYRYSDIGQAEGMKPMSYTVAREPQRVVTMTSDGKETENTAAQGDVIISGPSGETYVIKAAKFAKLYQGSMGETVIPEQNPRMVAKYTGDQTVNFMAPWGESMVLKPGDYLVKDGDAGYYRIAQKEYQETYNEPGQ